MPDETVTPSTEPRSTGAVGRESAVPSRNGCIDAAELYGESVSGDMCDRQTAVLDRGESNVGGLTVRPAKLELARPPRWLWEDRVALGYLNLLLGNEGVGKGTLIAWT